MKIGILTQPLLKNYGGILQAYALQKVLREMGHEAWLVQRCRHTHSFRRWMSLYLRKIIKYLLGRKEYQRYKWVYRKVENQQYANMQNFIDEYITPKTSKIFSSRGLLKDYKLQHYDAYVVGSDQVWRPRYSPCQTDFYMGFLPLDEHIMRLAYAASFGTDKWEYSKLQSKYCRILLQKFNGISVREDSAIELCSHYLGRNDVLQVLDPTLLLKKEEYECLADTKQMAKKNKRVFCYVLDDNSTFERLRNDVAHNLDGECFTITFTGENSMPGPKTWLRAFMEADYVLTDSFHGCVFSIIFNRPFVVVGNESRGQSRFHSLLNLFGLEDRMVTQLSGDIIVEHMKIPIQWDLVNERKKKLQDFSLNFLQNYLGN